jgi:DNA-directed RNA polymerase subunit RPC12/RpoP
MADAMFFECSECDEQFALPAVQVYAHTRLLCCPRCGSLDLEWIGDGPSALLADADIAAA